MRKFRVPLSLNKTKEIIIKEKDGSFTSYIFHRGADDKKHKKTRGKLECILKVEDGQEK